ncbi:oxysterol-binding protein-related protein 9/10/11 [Schistosoma bovis]|uniref:Oxysterol-binding protein-related protein 9/10/11 n=1 Tax=Schistosoma bovis TaxID=6184 RepID=A0A430QIM0_SCHBO|nr:oxysterol-binding protein-related protein 9/10/11 [Schistosoma bovis]
MNGKDRENIFKLIKRAKELQTDEEKNHLRKRTEGQLLKFTNVMKGYQYRWFVIDPDSGRIEYYENNSVSVTTTVFSFCNIKYFPTYFMIPFQKEDHKRSLKPRGALSLIYASICPSDEDSQTFFINAANAIDAKERQYWVDRLRAVAEYHSEKAEQHPLVTKSSCSQSNEVNHTSDQSTNGNFPIADASTFPVFCPGRPSDPRVQLGELFRQLELENHALSTVVDNLLLSKATSQATLDCLKRCMELIKHQEITSIVENGKMAKSYASNTTDSTSLYPSVFSTVVDSSETYKINDMNISNGLSSSVQLSEEMKNILSTFPLPIKDMQINCKDMPNDVDEIDDNRNDNNEAFANNNDNNSSQKQIINSYNDDDENDEHNKKVILHLLSQLKIGMELTKVVFPTFILAEYSLLEMFANYMAHPNLFCSWIVPPDQLNSESCLSEINKDTCKMSTTTKNNYNVPIVIRYCAEQVSHHPSVTAFQFSCPIKQMKLTGSLCTQSKFQGMSVCAAMLGKLILKLGEHNDEEYHFSLPTVYARSILTVPWVEFGDKVSVTCPQTGYSAVITFLTKPHYEDKLHCITGEIYNTHSISPTSSDRSAKGPGSSPLSSVRNSNHLIARISGEWNNIINFEVFNKNLNKWSVNVNQLPVFSKHIRPIEYQQPEESRRLWQNVTKALQLKNFNLATEKKQEVCLVIV